MHEAAATNNTIDLEQMWNFEPWAALDCLFVIKDQRRSGLEEKIRVLQSSRDELQSYSAQQSNIVGELQSRNSQLAIDNEALRRRLADLQQVSRCLTPLTPK